MCKTVSQQSSTLANQVSRGGGLAHQQPSSETQHFFFGEVRSGKVNQSEAEEE